jgi:uncharacterized protein (TIGR02453 family)
VEAQAMTKATRKSTSRQSSKDTASYRFSKETLPFLAKASKQKSPAWLEKNFESYENWIRLPLQHLAQSLKTQLSAAASGYHFPLKGIGRIKRSTIKAKEYGSLYKDYVSYSASKPSESRFDRNPSLFFLIQSDDPDGDHVLVAGGLYMPSSRQTRAIREAIAHDASAFDRLFASKSFSSRFPGGFSKERSSSRPPRGFDPQHPRMEWLKLQGFFVWRSYRQREFLSKDFPDLVAKDFMEILKLNELLEKAIQGTLHREASRQPTPKSRTSTLESRLEELELPRRQMDF